MEIQSTTVLAVVLFTVGAVLSLAPTYTPQASGAPFFTGTLWYVGVPLMVAGAVVAVWGYLREEEPADPETRATDEDLDPDDEDRS